PICLAASTMRVGSVGSSASGLPLFTAQKRHVRVHTDPMSMKVAVPLAQHSPLFGQRPLSQIVFNPCDLRILRVWRFSSVLRTVRRTHGGRRSVVPAGDISPSSLLSIVKPKVSAMLSPQ